MKILINQTKHTVCPYADTWGMDISVLLISLILSLHLCALNTALALNNIEKDLKQSAGFTEEKTGAGVSSEAPSVKCKLQGTTRLPVFSMDGDYVIGGVFSIHTYKHTVMHNYTTIPEPQRCTGRLVRGLWWIWLCYTEWLMCMMCSQTFCKVFLLKAHAKSVS